MRILHQDQTLYVEHITAFRDKILALHEYLFILKLQAIERGDNLQIIIKRSNLAHPSK